MVDRFYSDAWRLIDDHEEREARGETYAQHFKGRIATQIAHTRRLLSSPNVYHLNFADMESAQRLVNQLVRLDRLPKENTLEGLLLLQSAWREFDVSMLLADRYKFAFKISAPPRLDPTP
eukprot:7320346-Prymnesium_polylepis.2